MKKQMKFEKIICYVLLASTVLCFAFALGITTDLFKLYEVKAFKRSLPGIELFDDIQPFNKSLVMTCILLIIISIFLFITCTHTRRKYYISNYVSTIVCALANFGISIWAIMKLTYYKNYFLTKTDFTAWAKLKEDNLALSMDIPYTESTFWLDMSTITFIVLIIITIFLLINMIWKIMLINKENKLLNGGKIQ